LKLFFSKKAKAKQKTFVKNIKKKNKNFFLFSLATLALILAKVALKHIFVSLNKKIYKKNVRFFLFFL
jgi:hypothetical protein